MTPGGRGGEGCRLLIAEPEPMVARILEHKLRREGHEVRCCRDPDGAAREIADSDVALVDIDLDGDGVAWMATVVPPRLGWLAICPGRDSASAQRAVRAGAAGVVAKPFKPTVVAAQVVTLLSLARS